MWADVLSGVLCLVGVGLAVIVLVGFRLVLIAIFADEAGVSMEEYAQQIEEAEVSNPFPLYLPYP